MMDNYFLRDGGLPEKRGRRQNGKSRENDHMSKGKIRRKDINVGRKGKIRRKDINDHW